MPPSATGGKASLRGRRALLAPRSRDRRSESAGTSRYRPMNARTVDAGSSMAPTARTSTTTSRL
jgi:hypothetical protein